MACAQSSGDELLAAVDVVGRAGECGVGHERNGERGDVGRSDDAADGQRRAQLLAPGFESLVGEVRSRQRGGDEAGGGAAGGGGGGWGARGAARGGGARGEGRQRGGGRGGDPGRATDLPAAGA